MSEAKITSLATSGSVASRFVSSTELDEAKQKREEEWAAAYARIGEKPPPRPEDTEEYDPRSLYEKLSAQKEIKKEQWDEKMKLSGQFRGLEEDEIAFLAEIDSDAKKKLREQEKADRDQLNSFKAQQAKYLEPSIITSSSTSNSTPIASSSSSSSKPKPTQTKPSAKTTLKSKLKGVVIKKKDPKPKANVSSGLELGGGSKGVIPVTTAMSIPIRSMDVITDESSKRKRGAGGGLPGLDLESESDNDSSKEETDTVQPISKKSKISDI